MEKGTLFRLLLLTSLLLVALAVFISGNQKAGRYTIIHTAGGSGLIVLDSKTCELAVVVKDGDTLVAL